MFCKQCGNELIGTEVYCDACGAPVEAVRARSQVIAKRVGEAGADPSLHQGTGCSEGGGYRSYEYARTTVKCDLAQVTLDCYESLGYELTGQRASTPGGQVTLSFRRSRKVHGKAQLSKIQRTMDDCIASISSMEAEKTKKATRQALTIGIISALVFGVGMSLSMVWTQFMVLGIVVGIIGIAGCLFAWHRYRKTSEAETNRLNPQIESAYDRLATLCEEAQAVIQSRS